MDSYQWAHAIGVELWQFLTNEEREAALSTDIEQLNRATFRDAKNLVRKGNPAAAVYVERRLLAERLNMGDVRRVVNRIAATQRTGY
ncbi:hypothetical protein [Terriglobus sp. RCC_193]|uniref:hypothetical protein n=1 Tax=Terriglobus sp. RCC_193 TaxID=3239218 RepID=UPI00352533E9